MASQTLAPFWWAIWAATEPLLPVGPKTITMAIFEALMGSNGGRW